MSAEAAKGTGVPEIIALPRLLVHKNMKMIQIIHSDFAQLFNFRSQIIRQNLNPKSNAASVICIPGHHVEI